MLAPNGSSSLEAAAKNSRGLDFRKSQAMARNSLVHFKPSAWTERSRDRPTADRPKPFALASRSESTAGLEADGGLPMRPVYRIVPIAKTTSPEPCSSQHSHINRFPGTPLFSPQPSSKTIEVNTDSCRFSTRKAFAVKHPNRRFAFQTKQLFLPEALLHPTSHDARIKIPGFFDMRNLNNPQQQMLVANVRETLYTKVQVDLHGRADFTSKKRKSGRSANSSASGDSKSLGLSSSHGHLTPLVSSAQLAPRSLASQAVAQLDSASLDHLPASMPQSKREIENIDLQTGFLQQKLATPLHSPSHKKSKFLVRDLIKYTQLAHLGRKLSSNLATAFTLNFRKQSLDRSDDR